MASSDYKVKGSATLAMVAQLSAAVNPAATRIPFLRLIGNDKKIVVENTPAMINGEIVKITAVGDTFIDVERGCADTIPRAHANNSVIWFLNQSVGYDTQEYVQGESVAVKVLVKSGSRRVNIENSPPRDLTFVGRAFRPYPPGNVLVNGTPWFSNRALNNGSTDLAITWAHRDRVMQADILTGHQAGNIGPEPGTTYEVRVHTQDGTVVHTDTVTGTSWNYSVADARTHLSVGINAVDVQGYITLRSKRGAVYSMQQYQINLLVSGSGINPKRWGVSWGTSFAI